MGKKANLMSQAVTQMHIVFEKKKSLNRHDCILRHAMTVFCIIKYFDFLFSDHFHTFTTCLVL